MSAVLEAPATELPDGWESRALADLGQWCGGGTPSKQRSDYWEGGSIPWVSPKDMKARRLADTQDHITRAAVDGSAAKLFPANSIALVVRSGILEHTLPVALVPFEATANQDMRVLTPKPEISSDWALWALLAAAEDIRRSCQKDGTTVASIDVGRMQAYQIPVPPLDEQKRIVEIVEELMEQITEGERQLQSAIDAANNYRAAALRDALSGSWPTVHLGSALIDLRYGTSKKSVYSGAGVPVLRIPNISRGVVSTDDLKFAELTDGENDLLALRANDILIIRSNGSVGLVGRGARVIDEGHGMAYAGYLIRLRTDPNVLRPEFLELALAAPQVRIQVEGHARSTSGVHNINSDEVRGLSIPLPPSEEQDEIIRRSRIQLAAVDELTQIVGSQQVEARRLRQAVLRDAMSGKLMSEVYA